MYFFEKEERRDALYHELESWLGTPFRHHAGVKGLGCDCIHLVVGALEAVGVPTLKKIRVPDYAPDWHLHNDKQMLARGIEEHYRAMMIGLGVLNSGKAKFLDGDILLYHYGQASSHSALYCRGMVYQALNGMKAQKIDVRGEERSRLTHVYRVVEL